MKTITIGDIHGLSRWKTIDPMKFDKVIFLGDYLDSYIVRDDAIIQNFKEIIDFRQAWPEKVELLFGNHETSYMYEKYRASGYRRGIADRATKLIWDNFHLFRMAWQHDNFLWTHAGLHQDYFDKKILPKVEKSDANLAATLQRLFEEGYEPLFEVGFERGGKRANIGGPLWLDQQLLIHKPLKSYHQIVGHSRVNGILHYRLSSDLKTSVTLCDCQDYGDGSFYELEIKD